MIDSDQVLLRADTLPRPLRDSEKHLPGPDASLIVGLRDLQLPSVLIDRTGLIQWQNYASVALRGELTERRFAESLPLGVELKDTVLTGILAAGAPGEFAIDVSSADGSQLCTELSVVPLALGGAVVGIFGSEKPAGARSHAPAAVPLERAAPPSQALRRSSVIRTTS